MFFFKVMIVFSVYLNIGYFLKLGSLEIAYSEVLVLGFVLFGLFFVKRIQIPITSMLIVISFLLAIVCGYWVLVSELNHPLVLPIGGSWDRVQFGLDALIDANFGGAHIKRIIRIFIFIAAYYLVDKQIVGNAKRSLEVKKFIVTSGVIIAWLGIVEQFFKIVFSSSFVTQLASTIFGVGGSQLTWLAERGSYPVLQGLMLEPGHYAASFIPAIFILFRDPMFTEKERFWKFLLFAYVIFFTGSFAGFAIIFFLIALYLFSNRKKIIIKLFAGTGVAIIFSLVLSKLSPGLLNYYLLRLSLLLQNQSSTTSDNIRVLSIKNAIGLFENSPLLGVGFGSTTVHGFMPSMLANVGIIGTILWFALMFRGFTRTEPINILWMLASIPLFFFVGGLGTMYALDMIVIFAFVYRRSLILEGSKQYILSMSRA